MHGNNVVLWLCAAIKQAVVDTVIKLEEKQDTIQLMKDVVKVLLQTLFLSEPVCIDFLLTKRSMKSQRCFLSSQLRSSVLHCFAVGHIR